MGGGHVHGISRAGGGGYPWHYISYIHKGNKKITELRTILQRESQNSQLYKQTKSVDNQ